MSAHVISPDGREYTVLGRQGKRFLLLDETDGFRFLYTLSSERVARGWKLHDDRPDRPRTHRRRDHNHNRKVTTDAIRA